MKIGMLPRHAIAPRDDDSIPWLRRKIKIIIQ